MSTAREFEEMIREEVDQWPCVTVVFGHASKHLSAVLTFRGHSRKHFYPMSPGDHRGSLNSVTQVRRTLREMGAVRIEKPKPARDDREHRHKAKPAQITVRPGEKAQRPDTFFGPLAALRQQMVSA